MRLAQLARKPLILRAHLLNPEADLSGIRVDSRRVDAHTGFFALQGLRADGHAFLPQAAAAGAPALFVSAPEIFGTLCAHPPPGTAGIFLVPPGRAPLARLASLVYGAPSEQLNLLGVTGTNGKTTVTHLVAQISEALGERCGFIGSLGMHCGREHVPSDRTTPEAPDIEAFLRQCLAGGATAAAMEVSSIGIALERPSALRFRAAAFTNLTPEHLDFHADLDDYAQAKFRLFLEHAPGHAVINLDDPRGAELLTRLATERPEVPCTTFSLGPAADLGADGVRPGPDGMAGVLRHRGERATFATPLLGGFNLSNLLAATGLLLATGADLPAIAAALPQAAGAPGRFERVPTGRGFLAVVDYAHTPDALENVLRCARELTAGRVLLVFGCGGERDRAKRPLMGAIAERLADEVVLTNDNPRGEPPEAILAEIRSGLRGSGAVSTIPERREAIGHTLARAQAGDLVLVAGKGHETYQEIDGRKLPFDDRQVVRDWADS